MEEKNKQLTQEQIQVAKRTIVSYIIATIIVGIGIYAIFHYFYVTEPKKQEQESATSNILSVLNQSGYEYTNKSTFTKEDFTAEEVEKSDYKPIYKVKISNGDILYVCLIYPNGNKGGYRTHEKFIISKDLNRLKNSINQ